MSKPIASLSLDLDNLWTYLKTNGDPAWTAFPGYLDAVVPRILGVLERYGLKITFFIVGQDAARSENAKVLRSIADAGHEIANHSFHHEPWIASKDLSAIDAELAATEDAILRATGVRPAGFRGPSFALSADLLDVLSARGYHYDASTFPTYLGPLARAYYFAKSGVDREGREQRKAMFGTLADGLRPIKPFRWKTASGHLTEIPVSTIPMLRAPFHLTYVMFLARRSPALANAYFTNALRACRIAGISPSILLHPTEFIGAEDTSAMSFFPGMSLPRDVKLGIVDTALRSLTDRFDVVTMSAHCAAADRSKLTVKTYARAASHAGRSPIDTSNPGSPQRSSSGL